LLAQLRVTESYNPWRPTTKLLSLYAIGVVLEGRAHVTKGIHLIPWQRGDALARGECGSNHLGAKLGPDAW
jgi:hypothetical protein